MVERKPRLEGKVAIVTGAGPLLPGLVTVWRLRFYLPEKEPEYCWLTASRNTRQETLKQITAEGGQASIFAADVTKAQDCKAMVASAVERYGRLDILHNNVGIGGKGNVVNSDEWDAVLDSNLKSVYLTSKFAIPQMIAGGGGAIVTISSASAIRPHGHDIYSAAKGGVIALTQAMAATFGRQHIRANCIIVGPVFTPLVASHINTAEQREKHRLWALLETEGTAWDIGWAAVYLASDEARWVTGVAIPVDGGHTLTRRGMASW